MRAAIFLTVLVGITAYFFKSQLDLLIEFEETMAPMASVAGVIASEAVAATTNTVTQDTPWLIPAALAAETKPHPLPASRTLAMTSEDAVAFILDTGNSIEERRQRLKVMASDPQTNKKNLVEIASTNLSEIPGEKSPHSFSEMRFQQERSLRIAALEALDRMAADGDEVRTELEEILWTQNDPMIRFLVQLSLQGLDDGHPGKLLRFVETLAE